MSGIPDEFLPTTGWLRKYVDRAYHEAAYRAIFRDSLNRVFIRGWRLQRPATYRKRADVAYISN